MYVETMKNRSPTTRNKRHNSLLDALAAEYSLTPQETRLVNDIVDFNDNSMKSMKHPKIQEIIRQRKGRWVQEEEEYANFLSREFLLGLANIDDGTTKRSYLSSKLNCTKMRVSKKFKGQNSGKEVFHAKTVRPDGQPFTPEDIQHHEHRHAELEKDFIRATLHSIIKSGKNSQQRRKSDPFPPSRSIVPTRRNIKEPVHGGFIPSCAKAQRSTSLQLTTSSIVTQQLEPAPGYYRQPIPLFASHNYPMLTGNAIQVQQDYNFMPTVPGSMTQDQVVPNAPAAYNAPPLLHSNHAISAINCFDIMHNNDARVAMKEEGESKKRSVSELMSSVGYGFSPLIDEKRYKPTASHTVSTASDTSDPSSNDESEPFSHQGGNSATKPDSHNSDFSDLLSGFDKIQKKKVEKTTAPIPEDSHFFSGASIAESPYITSKSFDDLHKSLGAGLSGDKMSHLDLNNHSSGGGIPACVGGGDNVHTFEQVPFSLLQPSLDVCRAYYRPPSTSNSSDLTASD